MSEAVRSLDTRLDDLRRETTWRAIEGALDEKPAITVAPRTWRLPVFALATVAVIVALIVLPKPTRDGASTDTVAANHAATNPNGTNPNAANGTNPNAANGTNPNAANGTNPNGSSPNGANPSGTSPSGTNGTNGANDTSATNAAASDPPTTLSAAAGQRTVFERDGVILTLVGPGVATVKRENDLVRVNVTKGLVVADRTASAPALAVDAGANHVVSRDARFAVRVEPTMVVLGAGEQARQIVERHAIEMGAMPLPEPTTTVSPTTPSKTPKVAIDTTTETTIGAKNETKTGATTGTKAGATGAKNETATGAKNETSTGAKHETATGAKNETTTGARTDGTKIDGAKPDGARPDGAKPGRAPTLPDLRMDAAELYRRAEAALAIRDPAGAREMLERLLAEYPNDARVDAARYDLALIARSFGQRQRALELIDALIASGTDENLKAAARRLRPTLTAR